MEKYQVVVEGHGERPAIKIEIESDLPSVTQQGTVVFENDGRCVLMVPFNRVVYVQAVEASVHAEDL